MEVSSVNQNFENDVSSEPQAKTKRSNVKRFLPLFVIIGGLTAGYMAGLHEYLSLTALAEQRETLQAFVSENLVLAAALYFVCLLYTSPSPRDA